jgi:hypothetical protein
MLKLYDPPVAAPVCDAYECPRRADWRLTALEDEKYVNVCSTCLVAIVTETLLVCATSQAPLPPPPPSAPAA